MRVRTEPAAVRSRWRWGTGHAHGHQSVPFPMPIRAGLPGPTEVPGLPLPCPLRPAVQHALLSEAWAVAAAERRDMSAQPSFTISVSSAGPGFGSEPPAKCVDPVPIHRFLRRKTMKTFVRAVLLAALTLASAPSIAGPATVYMPDPTKKKISNGVLLSTIIPANNQAAIARIRSRGGGAQYIPQTILNPSLDGSRSSRISCETNVDIGGDISNRSRLTNGNRGVYVERLEVIETRPCVGAARWR